MPFDLRAEKYRVVTGSMDSTFSSYALANPNGVITEPSGSILRTQDGRTWVNINGGTVWHPFGPTKFDTIISGSLTGTLDAAVFRNLFVGNSKTALTKTQFLGPAEFTRDGASSEIAITTWGTSVQPTLTFHRGRGTAAASTVPQSGDLLASLAFQGTSNSGGGISGAGMSIQATENWVNSTNFGTSFSLFTTRAAYSLADRATRLFIADDGTSTFTKTAPGGVGIDVRSSTGSIVRVGGTNVGTTDAGYTGFVVATGSTPTELWYFGRDGTGPSGDLLFRRNGSTDVMTLTLGNRMHMRGDILVSGSLTGSGDATFSRYVGIGTAVIQAGAALDARINQAGVGCVVIRNNNASGYSTVDWYDNSNTHRMGMGTDNGFSRNIISSITRPLIITGIGNGGQTSLTHHFGTTDNQVYYQFLSGNSAAVSDSNQARFRYNTSVGGVQVSTNGGAYSELISGSGGNVSLGGDLRVYGSITGSGDAKFSRDLSVARNLAVTADITASIDLRVGRNAVVIGDLSISGSITGSGDAYFNHRVGIQATPSYPLHVKALATDTIAAYVEGPPGSPQLYVHSTGSFGYMRVGTPGGDGYFGADGGGTYLYTTNWPLYVGSVNDTTNLRTNNTVRLSIAYAGPITASADFVINSSLTSSAALIQGSQNGIALTVYQTGTTSYAMEIQRPYPGGTGTARMRLAGGAADLLQIGGGSVTSLQMGPNAFSAPELTVAAATVTVAPSLTLQSNLVSTEGPIWARGSGSPEGVVTAPVGSFYSRTDGGASTSWYVKESGAGNTGWVAK